MDLNKKSREHRDTVADAIFRKALEEFHTELLSHQATLKEEQIHIKYVDLIAIFEGVLSKVSVREQVIFPVTVGVNGFRGYLNEFVNTKKKKDKIKAKERVIHFFIPAFEFREILFVSVPIVEEEKTKIGYNRVPRSPIQSGLGSRADVLRGVQRVHVAFREDLHLSGLSYQLPQEMSRASRARVSGEERSGDAEEFRGSIFRRRFSDVGRRRSSDARRVGEIIIGHRITRTLRRGTLSKDRTRGPNETSTATDRGGLRFRTIILRRLTRTFIDHFGQSVLPGIDRTLDDLRFVRELFNRGR